MKSADQMREMLNQGQLQEQMLKQEQDATGESKANDTQSNSKFTSGLLGFFDNIKKNYFNNQKPDEKQMNEDDPSKEPTDPRPGS